MSNVHGHATDGTLQALIQFAQSHGLSPASKVELRTADDRPLIGITVEGDRELEPGETVVLWLSDEEPAPNGDDDRRYSFEGFVEGEKRNGPPPELAALLSSLLSGVPGDGDDDENEDGDQAI